MDSQVTEPSGDSREMETPEDVAVLYSWANLHGAKYRDFSASRREYRAQMRRRAAEQQREEELKAMDAAEAAAAAAEAEARVAEQAAHKAEATEATEEKERAIYELHEAQRRAKAERIEAERRAEAAKMAEDDLLRAEREMADAHESAQRQSARYAQSEQRRRHLAGPQPSPVSVPGAISDPYTPTAENQQAVEVEHHYHVPMVPGSSRSRDVAQSAHSRTRVSVASVEGGGRRRPRSAPDSYTDHIAAQARRAEFERSDAIRIEEEERLAHEEREARQARAEAESRRMTELERAQDIAARQDMTGRQGIAGRDEQRRDDHYLEPQRREDRLREEQRREEALREERRRDPRRQDLITEERHIIAGRRDQPKPQRPRGFHPDETSGEIAAYPRRPEEPRDAPARQFIPAPPPPPQQAPVARTIEPYRPEPPRAADPYRQEPPRTAEQHRQEPPRPEPRVIEPYRPDAQSRKEPKEPLRQDYRRLGESRFMGAASSRSSIRLPDDLLERMGNVRPASAAPVQPPLQEPGPPGPAWLYPNQQEENRPVERTGLHRARQDYNRPPERTGAAASPIEDTLQQSRERVAARWYALKGVFEGHPLEHAPEQEQPQPRPQELRTPVVAVFSLVGGVGRTSLVATLGRALSSMGERVLLMDTAAHSMLPFYFGASELRTGMIRTFSPPSGSTDAPISCVSYDVDQRGGDQAAQDWFAEELTRNSRGLQRILLDLSSSAGWVARRLARMNPTVLVPVSPDMNSVISLQSVERFFAGVIDGEGRQVQPYFLLNQFDASLPLHLDVREVLRRQLGDRLLPFVVRRAPAVPEALAEGMTVVDYAPDTAVSSDYMNVASWLRTVAAPATAGFRNLRWSER